MADKTQLLALTMAARYRLAHVVAGVLLATAILGAIAVGLGEALETLVPMSWLKIASGVAFLGFAVWTVLSRGDDGGTAPERPALPPFLAVGAAFFLAELGDKTQLAAVALAADYRAPIAVWAGFTLGMAAADGIGIGLGRAFGSRLPYRALKVSSAVVFALFGVLTLAEALAA